MTPVRRSPLPLAALAAAVCLAACTADAAEPVADEPPPPRVVQPGAPGEPSRVLDPEEAALAREQIGDPQYTDRDVRFMQDMIPHHVQALRMTRLVDGRTEADDIPLFAERMDISQEDELAYIQAWLESRDEEVPSLLATHGDMAGMEGMEGMELMPGMLTDEEFAALEAATGPEFDRLFLESMIRHHLGAIAMVEQLYEDDASGVEPQLAAFARHVVSDQSIEISRMQSMLAERADG